MQGLQEYVVLTVQACARVAGICGFDCTQCKFENDNVLGVNLKMTRALFVCVADLCVTVGFCWMQMLRGSEYLGVLCFVVILVE